jgi:hypothetical protein
MLHKTILALLLTLFASAQLAAQVSPWGTGTISTVQLDSFVGPSIYTSHTTYSFDLDTYLTSHSYNIYIPNSYDGTEPYGVITFINSGSNGALISSWIPVLEEKNIIMISGNNIGNSIPVVTRIAVALAGSEKLQEVLNIDTSRVYTSGNSGGGRSCTDLMWFFPEYFQGTVPNCGASFMRLVDQDYETYQLNSHYEYGIFPYSAVELDYVRSFDRKYAIMTAYDDFREGDIMNIYHNGMEPDGFKSKFMDIAGSHCATSSDHFRDAVNFVEHPHIDVILDSFALQPEVGGGFQLEAASIVNQQLVFDHNTANVARAYSNDPFLWNDEKGAIFRTTVQLDSATYNENSYLNIGLLDFSDPGVYNESVGHELYDSVPNFIVSVQFNYVKPTVHILAENPADGIANDTVFTGLFSDWSVSEPLAIKYHLWNQELRIEFDRHFIAGSTMNGMTKLLDDNRSIKIRTDANYWDSTDFSQGTLLTFVTGKLDTLAPSTAIKLNFVEVIVADTISCNLLANMVVDSVQSCTPYTWVDGNTYASSNTTATHTIVNPTGCDSVLALHLTIGASSATDIQSSCDTYTWIDGNTYTANNSTATHVITNGSGCDSVITLNLTINNSSTGNDIQTACNTYTWLDGITYTASNATATHTLTNSAGCDSLVTLNLTINTVNSSVTQAGPLLTADQTGATYQWFACPGTTAISGSVSQTYTATANGDYAVVVTSSGCSDTSACFTVTGIGIIENDFGDALLVYPNPIGQSAQDFSIDLGARYEAVSVRITDLSGRLVQSGSYSNSQLLRLKLDEVAGVYLLIVESDERRAVVRLVKE